MKKIILAITLAAAMIMSGCAAAAFVDPNIPRITLSPGRNSKIMDSLITKAQNNVASNTFEGMKGGSTLSECLDNIDPDKLESARVTGKTELLGYPAYVECEFNDEKSSKIHLNGLLALVYRRGEENWQEAETDILNKLDAELGSHRQEPGGFYDGQGQMMGIGECYVWEENGIKAAMTSDDFDPDSVVRISLYYPADASDEDIKAFPCYLGTDVKTVYGNLTSSSDLYNKRSADGQVTVSSDSAVLDFADEGILIRMRFKTDESGTVRLDHGQYYLGLYDMELSESIDYFESVADCFKSAIGAPYSRGYAPAHVDDYDENGIPMGWGYDTKQRLSAKDMLNTGNKYYSFNMNWRGIHFGAVHIRSFNIEIEFSEEFFK